MRYSMEIYGKYGLFMMKIRRTTFDEFDPKFTIFDHLTFICIFGRTNFLILWKYEWEIRSIYDKNTSYDL